MGELLLFGLVSSPGNDEAMRSPCSNLSHISWGYPYKNTIHRRAGEGRRIRAPQEFSSPFTHGKEMEEVLHYLQNAEKGCLIQSVGI